MTELAVFGGLPHVDNREHTRWPIIGDADFEGAKRVLTRGILSGSDAPEAVALGTEFASFQETKHALLTHSGTSALQVAVGALEIGEGDEVIIPAYSFVATAMAVISQGAIPIFVDVEYASGNIDANKIEAAVGPNTKAIMPVHVHGCPADMDAIMAIAKKHKLFVIEDAAQAHGARYKGHRVGGLAQGAGFSLQSSKNLSAGEGGIYTTQDDALFERANQVRNFGQNILNADRAAYNPERPLDGHKSLMSLRVGSMYRGNELMAAFARSQLQTLPALTARAQNNAKRFVNALREMPGLAGQEVPSDRESAWHKFRVWLDPQAAGVNLTPVQFRGAMLKALKAEGLEVGMWQSDVLPAQELFIKMAGYGKGFPFSAGDQQRLKANYDKALYPEAKRMLDGSFVVFSHTCPLIAQSEAMVDKYIQTFAKVYQARASLSRLV